MKFFAYLILGFGIWLFVDAVYDHYSGKAEAASPTRSIQTITVDKTDDPNTFKGVMSYQWIRAFLFLVAGYFLLSWTNRAERLDPFSTD